MEKKYFGLTREGIAAYRYIMKNSNGMEVEVSDFGALILAIRVPNKNKKLVDVALGFDSIEEYYDSNTGFGAYVGRNANRIQDACVVIDGKNYLLEKNDNGNNLHSGNDRSHKKFYAASCGENGKGNYIEFYRVSPHMEQGFPGRLEQKICYTLTDENELIIDYEMASDKTTVINPTNHSYFNLNGHASGSICNHEVWVDADAFTRADAESIPTGEITSVEGTPMDFRVKKPVGKDIDEPYEALIFGKGYDHNWALNNHGEFAKVVEMTADVTGITMEVYTDLPGVQIYSGNFLIEEPGKAGVVYKHRQGICFETQYFPDAVNHNNFESSICKAGESYRTTTVYKFK